MNKHLVTVEGKTLLIGRNLQQCQAQGETAVRLDRLGLKVKSIEREMTKDILWEKEPELNIP